MGVETALSQMIILFAGIILGFIAVKCGVIDDAGSKAVTKLVMNIILPLFIISSGLSGDHALSALDMLTYFGLSLVCYAFAWGLGTALGFLPLFPKQDKRLVSFMTTFGNTGFIGLPFIGGLFGSDAVLYATIFNLPFNFLVFSIGIVLVSPTASFRDVNPRMFVNPCLIASVAAIVLYLLGVSVPDVVCDGLDTLGSATVPLAMIITGASLAKETPRDVFLQPGLYLVSAVKLVAAPLFAYALLGLVFGHSELVLIGTMLMGMPVAANATMLCVQYGGNDSLASRGVFLSTLLAVVTVPLLVFFLG